MKFAIYTYSLLQADKVNTLNLGMKTPGGRKKVYYFLLWKVTFLLDTLPVK